MPNRRGKLKEHVEGIHRNCQWIAEHCSQSLVMIGEDNDEMTRAFVALAACAEQVDDFALSLYSQF